MMCRGIFPMLGVLAVAACSEPERPDAQFTVTMAGPDGVTRAATYDARFALLVGCDTTQTLQVNATGAPDRAVVSLDLYRNRAMLQTLALRPGEFGYGAGLNGWFGDARGRVVRQDLGENRQALRIEARAKGNGVWSGEIDQMPDVSMTLDGTFEKIAAYGPGGKTECIQ